ncbi:hypothetical protein RIL183_16361 [Roseburia inulinivorans]|uniref:CopG-like ribbon-helix-helix domain-containing protein n=1 Tax=Roseburia inulinivorans TaxID=360807 RepID=A0A0M6WIG6_9FIRM|nr:hypothetical protein [Roseburia inulinivorans]CRL35244.1 hypothetical protein RIL183_16361 [Roseburia inulinivorans]
MPSNKPQLKAVINEEEYNKFKAIAEAENRSVSNLLQTLVKDKIKEYENEHGNIKINMLKNDGTIHNVNM